MCCLIFMVTRYFVNVFILGPVANWFPVCTSRSPRCSLGRERVDRTWKDDMQERGAAYPFSCVNDGRLAVSVCLIVFILSLWCVAWASYRRSWATCSSTCHCLLFYETVWVASIAAHLVQTSQGALILRRTCGRCRVSQQWRQLSTAGRTCDCRHRCSGVHPAARISCLYRVVA